MFIKNIPRYLERLSKSRLLGSMVMEESKQVEGMDLEIGPGKVVKVTLEGKVGFRIGHL